MNNPASPCKILVVDDQPILRDGIKYLLQQIPDFKLVGEAENSLQALEFLKDYKPHVAIIDILLEGSSGLELTKRIAHEFPNTLVLILTMFSEDIYGERALRAGAKGYLLKHEGSKRIVEAIRTIISGELFISDKLKNVFLNRFIHNKSGSATLVDALTDREMEIFQNLAIEVSTQKIAQKLHISVKTVESHIANMKQKLSFKSSKELMKFAIEWFNTEAFSVKQS